MRELFADPAVRRVVAEPDVRNAYERSPFSNQALA